MKSLNSDVTVLYRHGRKLVGDHTVQVTESLFADDLAPYAASQAAFESVGRSGGKSFWAAH